MTNQYITEVSRASIIFVVFKKKQYTYFDVSIRLLRLISRRITESRVCPS